MANHHETNSIFDKLKAIPRYEDKLNNMESAKDIGSIERPFREGGEYE